MRSEQVFSAPQNCTFIGCSNEPVVNRIQDSTSARRFWQVDCADRLNWEAINQMAYIALWQSVDENCESPVLIYMEEITRIQHQELRSKDPIEEWLMERFEFSVTNGESPTTSWLYEDFQAWCLCSSVSLFHGKHKFSRLLQLSIKNLGWRCTSTHSNRGTVWSLKLSRK